MIRSARFAVVTRNGTPPASSDRDLARGRVVTRAADDAGEATVPRRATWPPRSRSAASTRRRRPRAASLRPRTPPWSLTSAAAIRRRPTRSCRALRACRRARRREHRRTSACPCRRRRRELPAPSRAAPTATSTATTATSAASQAAIKVQGEPGGGRGVTARGLPTRGGYLSQAFQQIFGWTTPLISPVNFSTSMPRV